MAEDLVAPGVRRVRAPNPGLMTGPGTNTFVLGLGAVAIIDPGPLIDSHIEAILTSVGEAPILGIWLTHAHPDHAAAVGALQRLTGAPLLAWPTPSQAYTVPELNRPAIPLKEGDQLQVDGEFYAVLHTPGHSSDHVCFYRQSDSLLFAGDVVAGQGTIVIAPPDGNLAHYLQTLARLKALGARTALPSHGEPILSPDAKFQAYIDHRMAREIQVIAALERGSISVSALVGEIYASVDARLHPIATGQIHGHLLKLEGEGLVSENAGHWSLIPPGRAAAL